MSSVDEPKIDPSIRPPSLPPGYCWRLNVTAEYVHVKLVRKRMGGSPYDAILVRHGGHPHLPEVTNQIEAAMRRLAKIPHWIKALRDRLPDSVEVEGV